MKTNKSYNWLISEKQAEKLRQLGFDENNEQIVKLFEKSTNLIIEPSLETFETTYYKDYLENPDKYIPLYTYEQVLEWFREKGFRISLENHEDSTKFMFYNMKINRGKHFKGEYSSYEEAREALINKLIKIYENSIQEKPRSV